MISSQGVLYHDLIPTVFSIKVRCLAERLLQHYCGISSEIPRCLRLKI